MLLSILLFLSTHLAACTGMKLTATDGSYVHGRTLEFGTPVDTSAAVIPRGYSFRATTPNGPGLIYKSKYAVVGTTASDNTAILDGLNEMGLSVATFYFPDFAGYTPTTKENQLRSLSPSDFAQWILTQFATCSQVREGVQEVYIAPTVLEEWGPTPAPFHYIVYDADGNCLVIEPLGGKLILYDNEIGVLTNSPTFDWHMLNLRNYINLSPYNATPISLNSVILKQFGQGSGMVGLPGDFTPPSRFVRAAIFSGAALPPKTANQAVLQLFHLLNQFDIPLGSIRETTGEMTYSPYTQATSVKDPQSLRYYFKTFDDQTIQMIDLTDFNLNANAIKILKPKGITQIQNISQDLR